ncbi:MAG: ATP-binding protein [Candidatus Altiarchaeales archaeon HGW-Altiarchaeales-2]|nr:MAG: ATP-binding protein [Candidatus Altiarchaeales archaeon HGW-Altiarchaeales-2]
MDKSLLETFFKEKSNEDVFNYLVGYFKNIAKHKTPVLVIDELQMIGDLEINGKLIYKLFNFFIGLTKELHLCHVFALSSDSLFIEKVYNEAILKDRCRYLLIDNFDEETTKKFLKQHNFSEKEQENIYNYIGGKPAHLIRIIDAKNQGADVINEIKIMLESRNKEIKDTLRKLRRFGSKIEYDKVPYNVDYNEVISILSMFKERDKISADDIDDVIKMFLVKNNILFAECANETIKPQSRLDLLAIREILKEMKFT